MANFDVLIHQLFQVSRAMTKDLNHRMAPIHLTQSQLAVLEYLRHHEPSSSLVDIAKYLSVEKSSVTRVVNNLEKNNFIERAPSNDSREKRIMLSERSVRTQKDVQQMKNDFESNTFQNISQEEIDVTCQTLLKMLNNINGVDLQKHE